MSSTETIPARLARLTCYGGLFGAGAIMRVRPDGAVGAIDKSFILQKRTTADQSRLGP